MYGYLHERISDTHVQKFVIPQKLMVIMIYRGRWSYFDHHGDSDINDAGYKAIHILSHDKRFEGIFEIQFWSVKDSTHFTVVLQ